MIALIIQLLSGAAGGNIAGALLKNFSLGTMGNTIAGVVGGGLGGQILGYLAPSMAGAGGLDIGSIISQVISGGAGGGVLMVIVSLIKQAMGNKA